MPTWRPPARTPLTGAAFDPFVFRLSIFVLAVFVGYYVVWAVTPALHTPLMAVTNAISSVIVVGALLAVGRGAGGERRRPDRGAALGFVALVFASVNIFGGFLVTAAHAVDVPEEKEVMPLGRSRRRSGETALEMRSIRMNANLAACSISSPACSSSWRCAAFPARRPSRRGNMFGMIGMAIAVVTTLAAHPPAGLGAATLVLLGLAIGGGVGAVIARRVPMTSMPQLVAAFHSLVGMSACWWPSARSMRPPPSTSARRAGSSRRA